jgi:hypothetical protein
MVHWKRQNRTTIRGSSGGGVSLPPNFNPPPPGPTPAPPACVASIIWNTTDTSGPGLAHAPVAITDPANQHPEYCRSLCCKEPTCRGWTYTDPQPGSTTVHDCWLKGHGAAITPAGIGNGCTGTDGHCWSGLTSVPAGPTPPPTPPPPTPPGLNWRAAAFASVPLNPPRPPKGVGLSLWTNADPGLAGGAWELYEKGTCFGTLSNTSGVICADMVPDSVQAGYLGDNYVWKEADPDGGWVFYVLIGSNKCPAAQPWCGYADAGATPQALLFKSTDLLQWSFASVFWAGPSPLGPAYNRVDTPDTFPLGTAGSQGKQAFIWLTAGTTIWMIGTVAASGAEGGRAFTEESTGLMDTGSLVCQQSLSDHMGRRVQLGWVQASGDGWDGAQSLPRQISASADGSKLLFAPLPEVWDLHGPREGLNRTALLAVNQTADLASLAASFGLQVHYRLTLAIDLHAGAAAVLDIAGGHAAQGTTIAVRPSGSVPPSCGANTIVNNSDSTGSGPATTMGATQVGEKGAEACRQMCCDDATCTHWTFTDPQPGSTKNLCWIKTGGGGQIIPGGCDHWGSGHCWSGLVGGGHGAGTPLELVVNGGKPLPLSNFSATHGGSSSTGTTASVLLDVFVDGCIVEVFGNDGEVAVTASQVSAATDRGGAVSVVPVAGSSASAAASADAGAGRPVVTLDVAAWGMKPSIS